MATKTSDFKRGVKNVLRPGLNVLRYLSWVRRDASRNRRWSRGGPRILVARDCLHSPSAYEVILEWLEENFPEVRELFELRRLPCHVRDWSPYVLHVPWLADPVQRWSSRVYAWSNRLAEGCNEHRIPVINPVERLTNATKAIGARLIASAGIRTPRTEWVDDVEKFKETFLGLSLPLIVRDDWGHNAPMYRAETPAELRELPIDRLRRPIAVEFIDVRSPHDGLHRKYRYVAVGDEGVALHLHTSTDWITRGRNCEHSQALIEEEREFLRGDDPNHERLQRARRALGLDFVAFDYSYDSDGELVVWEANPFPLLHFPEKEHRNYRRPALERTLAGLIKLYLQKAGLPVPPRIDELLSTGIRAEASSAAEPHPTHRGES